MLQKPNNFIMVWSFVYANCQSGFGEIDVIYACSRLKISKTSFRRIIQYGESLNVDGFKVVSKWNANILTISINGSVGGAEMVSDWFDRGEVKKPKKPRKPKQKSDSIFPKMIERYNSFIIEQTNMGAKINATEGKAMKSIIAYLKSQVKSRKNYNFFP